MAYIETEDRFMVQIKPTHEADWCDRTSFSGTAAGLEMAMSHMEFEAKHGAHARIVVRSFTVLCEKASES